MRGMGNKELTFVSIYKGNLDGVNRLLVVDIVGSGKEYWIEDQEKITNILNVLNQGEYRLINKNESETMNLLLSDEGVTIESKTFSLDTDSIQLLIKIYNEILTAT